MRPEPGAVFPRSAPDAWGEWPPEQARLDDAGSRAYAAACRIALERAYPVGTEVELWLHQPADFEQTYFAKTCDLLGIGTILVRAEKVAWSIQWMPATGKGHLREFRVLMPHEIEAATREMTRIR
jgi:hypothetical protein